MMNATLQQKAKTDTVDRWTLNSTETSVERVTADVVGIRQDVTASTMLHDQLVILTFDEVVRLVAAMGWTL